MTMLLEHLVVLQSLSTVVSGVNQIIRFLINSDLFRYLQKAVMQLDRAALSLVFEALHERQLFLEAAPHLTQPLPIMTPCYK